MTNNNKEIMMKKILMVAIALFFVSCAHNSKHKACCAKDAKQCKMDKKKCDKKSCKTKKHDHKNVSASECDLNSCKIHRSVKAKK